MNVVVNYVCSCSPGEDLSARFPARNSLVSTLIGSKWTTINQRWQNPSKPRAIPEDDPELAHWRYEVSQVVDADEFVRLIDLHGGGQLQERP